jgi:hypothetical protein
VFVLQIILLTFYYARFFRITRIAYIVFIPRDTRRRVPFPDARRARLLLTFAVFVYTPLFSRYSISIRVHLYYCINAFRISLHNGVPPFLFSISIRNYRSFFDFFGFVSFLSFLISSSAVRVWMLDAGHCNGEVNREASEMYTYWRMLEISWIQKVTNESVFARMFKID